MEKEFKGTKGLWKEIDGILYDEEGLIVPSKGNFFATSGTEEWFKDNEEYIKSKHNDTLKEHAPELLQSLRDLVWLFENHAGDDELTESINLRAKKVLEKILK